MPLQLDALQYLHELRNAFNEPDISRKNKWRLIKGETLEPEDFPHVRSRIIMTRELGIIWNQTQDPILDDATMFCLAFAKENPNSNRYEARFFKRLKTTGPEHKKEQGWVNAPCNPQLEIGKIEDNLQEKDGILRLSGFDIVSLFIQTFEEQANDLGLNFIEEASIKRSKNKSTVCKIPHTKTVEEICKIGIGTLEA